MSQTWTAIFHYVETVPATEVRSKQITVLSIVDKISLRFDTKNHVVHHFKFLKDLIVQPVSVLQWVLLNSPGKMSNFQTFSVVSFGSRFSSEETGKPVGDEMEIQRSELVIV